MSGNFEYPDRRYAACNSSRVWTEDAGSDISPRLTAEIEALYNKATNLGQTSRWNQAIDTYVAIFDKTREWTGTLREQVGVLQMLRSRRSMTIPETREVKLYLRALEQERKGYWSTAGSMLTSLANTPSAGLLADRVRYQLAGISYEFHRSSEAVRMYGELVRKYPNSPKREDALIMIARICILSDSPDKESLATGRSAIRTLLADYPHTRFYRSAFGLQARVHFLTGRYQDALWCYFRIGDLDSVRIVCNAMPGTGAGPYRLRLLETYLSHIRDRQSTSDYSELTAVHEVNQLRNLLSLEMIGKLHADLKDSSSLLASYIYYRLYYTNTRERDLASLAVLAREALLRAPQIRMNASVELRLAEVEYQQRNYSRCIEWAKKALDSGVPSARAHFVRASGEAKTRRYFQAQQDLTAALALSHDHALRQSARELLALTYENSGDPGAALDQYYALGYDRDVAYLLDVRMNAEQIIAYAKTCEDVRCLLERQYQRRSGGAATTVRIPYTRRQLLYYTAGIHYLRLEKWDKAVRWLSAVPTNARSLFDLGRREWGSTPSPDSLVATKDLRQLQHNAARRANYEDRAAAAYRYASYYHTHGALLLYNPMLWQGYRVGSFEGMWNPSCGSHADDVALEQYLSLHETYLRARALCLAVARRYPRSASAPKALYRAACAAEHGSALEHWMQNARQTVVPQNEGRQLLLELVRSYPHSPLVAPATKYAQVFAGSGPSTRWPNYADQRRGNARHNRDGQAQNELDDMDTLLALAP